MRKLKKYSIFMNESVRSFMIPKSEKEIMTLIGEKSPNDKLLLGAEYGILSMVKSALKDGANINVTQKEYWTPLIIASMEGNTEIMEYLIENGADMEHRTHFGSTAIVFAIDGNKLDAVKILVEAGTNINVRANNDGTPFISAGEYAIQ